MFGWPMEEEAKLEFIITVNWRREDGSIAMRQLGVLDRGACRSAEDVGLQLADAKPILGRLQEIVVSQQLERHCEVGRVETSERCGEAFAVVRDLDPYAKRRVQAVLRRCGRGQDTDLRILSDGEDGLRGVVGTWFGKKSEHRLDWFHVARRIARIEKEFLYLPYGDDFQERLAVHWANMNSMKWMLWNDGVDMAEFGMSRVRIGLFQHALAHPGVNSERFESIEAKLDELRSYLYANRESVRGYAKAYRNGERISTANVESTVNQLINWRMCKKQQMGWSRAGAQQLLHVKTAIINGRLDRHTGHHSVPADIAA
jgi:hypothetical protein